MNKELIEWFTQLNQRKIRYAIGGSWMLKEYGLAIEPKDIDLFIHMDDILRCFDLIEPFQVEKTLSLKSPFQTTFFVTLQIGSFSVEIMGGFAYLHDQGLYRAIFDEHSIVSEVIIDDVHIPLMSLEEWYVLYSIMGRQKQCELIEHHWLLHGIHYPECLQRQLECALDDQTRTRIISHLTKNNTSM